MASDKLISANYLLDKVQYRIDTPGIIGSTVRDMVATTRRIIEEAPAVDAVKVVRCKDCVAFGRCHTYDFLNFCRYDFCAKGKRRDE